MQHLPSETLALNALGEASPEETAHLEQCAQCSAEVAAMQRVVHAGRIPSGPDVLPRPPSSVWEGIHSSLGLSDAVRRDPFESEPGRDDDAAGLRDTPEGSRAPEHEAAPPAGTERSDAAVPSDAPSSPVTLSTFRDRRNRRRTRLPQILGAAAAAVVLAAAGTWGISRILTDRSEVVAAVDLTPLPAYEDTGRAEVDQRPDGARELVVTATGSDAQGFREVWLIAPDITRMVSLGTMEGTEGRFTIPANLDLDEYPIVDISDEPFDGDPTHSGDSILRGVLEL